MDITLRVSPDKLAEKAEELRSLQSGIDSTIMEIQTLIENSVSFWEGEAADSFLEKGRKLNSRRGELKRRLSKTPENLMEISGIYQITENSANEAAQAMNAEVLE